MGMSLLTIPLEILEHIAFHLATDKLSGPPTDLISLSFTCKELYRSLAISRNSTLYAAIFSYKFDTEAIRRRLGPEGVTASALTVELFRRFDALRRLQHGEGSQIILSDSSHREDDLWIAILMMLENDGKNAIQLKEFGRIADWLKNYFLEIYGGSYIQHDNNYSNWPRNTPENRMALWLLYLCENDGIIISPLYADIYRAFAVGANRYHITPFTWTDFRHPCLPGPSGIYPTEYFNHTFHPTCPSIALPAILGHMSHLKEPILWRLSSRSLQNRATFRKPLPNVSGSKRWDMDWERWKPVVYTPDTDSKMSNVIQRYLFPSIFDGTWEGLFTIQYMDFGVFAAILSGEPPHIATDSTIGQNLHIWKIREYHLHVSSSNTSILPPGPPQNAFFPTSATITDSPGQVVFSLHSHSLTYTRAKKDITKEKNNTIKDIILLGEGHSAWGEFRLKGRVRAGDGFITVVKEYNGPDDRGRWLYRGYLIGGKYVGRWRDTMTPTSMVGYEGGFELYKRS
ncbi:hypothetical protein Clacol_008266 [Clathrus columnatus]|uniref:F-box domain-containing protein n=1 Tax=Clathrus columnatus TaxID=1419009 RepID=A0AAV5AHA6_9AGAM|nr:hypothetical protein Clacol_008266 [Clathrus columnatus]